MNKCGMYHRNMNLTSRYSPGTSGMEKAKCASEAWKAAKAENLVAVNIVFGVIDNDDDIEEILCKFQRDLKLVYTILEAKPTIFADLNNSLLVKKVDDQDSQAH